MAHKQILLVDDEDMELQGLAGMIRAFGLDASVVGMARNGIEGYNKIMQLKPDIIISDIKMPRMDGIEMARELRRNGCDAALVYISGYQDFMAVRDAVAIGAKEFLLKPISRDKLRQTLLALCDPLPSAGEWIGEPLSPEPEELARAAFLQRLLFGSHACQEGELLSRAATCHLPIGKGLFAVVTVQIAQAEAGGIPSLLPALRQISLRHSACPPVETRAHAYSILFSFPIFMQEATVTDLLEKAGEELADCLHDHRFSQAHIGVSGTMSGVCSANALYQQSLLALDSDLFQSTDRLVFYVDDPSLDKQLPADISVQYAQILQCILDGDERMVSERLEQLISSWQSAVPFDAMQQGCIELTAYAAVLCKRNSIVCDEKNIYWRLIHASGADELRSHVKSYFELLTRKAAALRMDHTTAVIQQILKIIHEEYRTVFTIEDIARRVYLSASYIRRLFKSQTGQTILNYLQAVRMEKALELLSQPQYKIHEIGMMVGYENPSYFNLVFKKYHGITPGAYRDQMTKKDGSTDGKPPVV